VNTSKYKVQFFRKLVSSSMKGRNLSFLPFGMAVASLLVCGMAAKATNALVNPGAETGDTTGWTVFNSGSAVSTNSFLVNGGDSANASNVMAFSGAWVFKTYNTSYARTMLYQDIAASAGSQWSGSVHAYSHAQDYISPGSTAHMQVVFYDGTGTNALAVYGSDILDPIDPGFPFTVAPPEAVDSNGWLYLQADNLYTGDPASEANWSGPVATNLVAPAGTAFVRYQLEFDGGGPAGSVFWDDCDLDKVVAPDPDILTTPVAQTVIGGRTATFTVAGTGSSSLSYQWQNGTNALVDDGRISGATNATLTIANCVTNDSGNYSVIITDSNGSIRSVPVALTVIDPVTAANVLGLNAGFEQAPNWTPWHPFGGNSLYNTNNVYYQTTDHINVHGGNWVAHIYRAATDNGFYYANTISAPPGSVWKGSGWAYVTSGPDNLSSSNSCRLQVWFKNSSGARIGPVYESFKIWGLAYTNTYPMLPRDTWVYLPITNVVDGTDTPTNFVQTFVAPPGSVSINYQVYYGGVGSSGGSVFWDDMALYQITSVTNLTATVSGNNVNLSFTTQGASVYSILYKTNLSDGLWSVLTNNIMGDGYMKIISDPMTAQTRFYKVQTQ
jgi:hypothetical protein